MQTEHLMPDFMGIVRDFQASAAKSEQAAHIRAEIDRAGVLVMKNQRNLDDDALLAFAKSFGEPHHSIAAHRPDLARRLASDLMSDISNLERNGSILPQDDMRRIQQRANLVWHTDNSFRVPAGEYTFLAARIVPQQGGETEFADARAAYDMLPADLKQHIDSLHVEHSLARTRQLVGTDGVFNAEEDKRFPSSIYPLIRRNPRTGRKALYIGSHAARIVGWLEGESRRLLDELLAFATRAQFVYRHTWSSDDLVMWDNTATLHRAIPFDDVLHRRDLRRVSTTLAQA